MPPAFENSGSTPKRQGHEALWTLLINVDLRDKAEIREVIRCQPSVASPLRQGYSPALPKFVDFGPDVVPPGHNEPQSRQRIFRRACIGRMLVSVDVASI